MKRILLALSLLAGSIASANAACVATSASMKDAVPTTFAMGMANDANGNCASKVDADTSSQIHTDLTAPPTLGSASGGTSVKTLAALSNTAVAVKASAGQLYRGQCSNRDATNWASLQIFNVAAASVTVGTTAPTDFVDIPPGTNTGFVFSLVGEQYSTAISAAAATTPTGGTVPVTALNCTISYN